MKKYVFGILFVLFSLASFTLVDYQPLEIGSVKTELTVDSVNVETPSYNYEMANVENVVSIISEKVAISRGKPSQINIVTKGLEINNVIPVQLFESTTETFRHGQVAIQTMQNKSKLFIKKGKVIDCSAYTNNDKSYITLVRNYLKIDGTVNEQRCQLTCESNYNQITSSKSIPRIRG